MSKRFKNRKIVLKKTVAKPDWLLVALILGLTVFGVVMVGNASVAEAYRDFGDNLYFLRLQAQWAGLGCFAFFVASVFNHRRLKILAAPLMFFSILALGAVLIPGLGIEAFGARRWLGVGRVRFQPAELAKFAFVFYLAAFLSNKRKILPFLLVMALWFF